MDRKRKNLLYVIILLNFFFLSFFLNTSSLLAANDDDPQFLTVYAEKDENDNILIYAHNLQTAELTLTLEAELKNLIPDKPLPMTMTIPGNFDDIILTLSIDNPYEAWSYKYVSYWDWGPLEAEHDDTYVYRLPYEPGSSYDVTQGFNGSFSHSGDFQYAIDFGLPSGTAIYACREGVVAAVQDKYSEGGTTDYYRNRVNYVMIKHPDGTIGEYDHLEYKNVLVNVGDSVAAGQLIGYSDNTGYSSGPHLHFMVYKAIDGHSRQSFPVKFWVNGSEVPVTLEEGNVYEAPLLP